MLKTLKAAWNVLTNKDINSTKPIEVKGPTKKEIEAFRQMKLDEKAAATERGEPWVDILTLGVDYNDLSTGNFELDWNDKFVAQCMRHGYVGDTDADIIDQWFTDVCRNVVLETYEQGMADPSNRPIDLGDGRRSYE